MVSGNNLYSKKAGSATYTQHTDDGQENIIFNGIPDWVYEGTANFENSRF